MSYSILIPSCDRYSDVWPTLLSSIRKFSIGQLPKIYLQTNENRPEFEGVNTLDIGPDVSWSDNVLMALESIEEEYVLLWIDDLILMAEIDWSDIFREIRWFTEEKGNYLRLNPTPAGQNPKEAFSSVSPSDYYRTSTVFSIWKKSALQELLVPGENPWQLEIMGSRRSAHYEQWYASSNYLIPYVNLIIKGKVHPSRLREIQTAGLEFESCREVMTSWEYHKFRLTEIRSRIFSFLPPRIRKYRYFFGSS